MSATAKHVYKVLFLNAGKLYEIYAREVSQGALFGFVEVSGLLFGEKTKNIVDPSEEALQREFDGVERTYIPLHSVVRIDEVQKRGSGSIQAIDGDGKVTPISVYPPPTKGEG